MTEARFWGVCYDVRDERRLRRVAKVMERYGARKQKSVFECWLSDALLAEMREAVLREMNRAKDSLRLYPLCRDCVNRVQAPTGGGVQEEPKAYIIA